MTHLAFFDDTSLLSLRDADAFRAQRDEFRALGDEFPDIVAERHRHLSGSECMSWFSRSRSSLVAEYRVVDPGARLPWYGPDFSVPASITGRLMETWAHGQDVADALGVRREPTARLRHVAHLGVAARPFSFAAHRRPPPDQPVRVELLSPGRDVWLWGPPEAADRVTGSALDFCLVVTQRRHLGDTSLLVSGPVAAEWMSIAQAFAGPPGAGREPGQFRRGAGT